MFERLRRGLAGPSTSGRNRGLADLNASTPYRFRTWLANAANRELAAELAGRHPIGKAEVSIVDEEDGRVRLEVVCGPGHLRPNILRSLDAIHDAGVAMLGFEALDLVTEVDQDELRRAVVGRSAERSRGAFGRQLDALAGQRLIDLALEGWVRAERSGQGSLAFAWAEAAICAGFNTPGGEVALLDHALRVTKGNRGSEFLDGVRGRVRLCVRTGLPCIVPESALLTLLGRRGLAGEAAAELAGDLPLPLSDAVVQALCVIAGQSGTSALYALIALRRVPASPTVRAVVEAALEAGDPDVQAVALETLATLVGTEARPAWEAFLEARSANRRMTGEWVVGKYGDAQDVPRVALHLAKLIRSRPASEMAPPRASSLIELLVRHREVPEAQTALADVTARWGRLTPHLRSWLEATHGWLAPAGAGLSAADDPASHADEGDVLEPESLEWPMPTIKRNGRNVRLDFWEMDHDVRDRFQELLESESGITVVDGDREWLTLIMDTGDPEELLARLWVRANAMPA